ncbi:hypothetical protein ASS64_14390 [Erythrobacter sp. AP23]|nr:hypothetical protein ASS64_14390 [Erythrobacter sp. AP23]
MRLLKILRDQGLGVTVHGFRSAFRDWVAEQTDYPGDVAEAALAHLFSNKVEAAYRRTDFLDKRRELLGARGVFCAATAVISHRLFRLSQRSIPGSRLVEA